MSNILETIVAKRRIRVEQLKAQVPVATLEQRELFQLPTLSLAASVANPLRTGIITEFKKASPSKGIIHATANVVEVYTGYSANGSSGVSILTEPNFFGGSDQDILAVSSQKVVPILRKDFTVDEYQVVEAKSIGADAILLIAACLSPAEVKNLATLARSLQLEVLLELHKESELDRYCDEISLVGINNRNLKTFQVDLQHSIELAKKLPAEKLKIAESGIHEAATLLMLKQEGFDGFLIGENFMKHENPAIAFADFVNQVQTLQKTAQNEISV